MPEEQPKPPFSRKFVTRLRDWYRGEYIPPPKNNPSSSVFIISPGHYEQPPLAKILRRLGRFWLDHWKWIVAAIVVPVVIAVITA